MKVEAILWVLILISLALAIVSRKYRRYGTVVIGLAVVAIVTGIVLAPNHESSTTLSTNAATQQSKRVDFERSHVEKLDREDPQAKTRIAVAQVRFDQVSPSTGSEPGTFESVRARLYNDSGSTLTDFGYYLALQDCIANVCTTIYDQRGLESATIPANQARDVKIVIHAGEAPGAPQFKLLGTPKIILVPSETRAYMLTSVP